MAVTLRLSRVGKKHKPYYRIIAIDKRRARDTKYIEKIGSYNPLVEKDTLVVDVDRFNYWKKQGAEISAGLFRLLKKRKLK